MTYCLADNLSYCASDGRFVFLDIVNDRYIALEPALEQAFQTLQDGGRVAPGEADALIALKIICKGSGAPLRPSSYRKATTSVLEAPSRPRLQSLIDLLRVAFALSLVSHRMARAGLSRTLAVFNARNTTCRAGRQNWTPDHYVNAVRRFHAARKYIPGDVICLKDSLALGQFLHGLNMPATLVIAVTANPFAAHAWLQWETMVLNDSLGYVRHHRPIYVS